MKIIKLTAENIKRLTAVEISPEGNVITIGGKNGAGKSSVLDSIAYALGGQKLVPEKPIREGEVEAFVEVQLDSFIISRRFWLQTLMCNCGTTPHNDLCDSLKKPSVRSTLTVKSNEGYKYTSPQATLDKLLGELSFDPLAFARTNPENRARILRGLVGLDTSDLDRQREIAFGKRTELNRQQKVIFAKLTTSPNYAEVPEEEISIETISKEMHEVELLREKAISADQEAIKTSSKYNAAIVVAAKIEETIDRLTKELKQQRIQFENANANVIMLRNDLEEKFKKASEAKSNIPDIDEIGRELKRIEDTNIKVRANKIRKQTENEYEILDGKITELTNALKQIEEQKIQMLEQAKFPIGGLGLEDNDVTFNGIPFSQASTAEQLKISIAIGLALNPELKILLIRDANALDSDSLKLIAELAKDNDAQLWLERVAETKEGAMIMIEDGAVI